MALVWPQPSVGDLVSCRFPFDDPSIPGAKARPCLVIKVLQNTTTKATWLDVIPGTGQGTSTQAASSRAPLLDTEFEEPADPQKLGLTHLDEATRFDFDLVTRVPYNGAYFSASNRQTPVFGSASAGLRAWLNAVKTRNANAATTVQQQAKPIQVIIKKARPRLISDPPLEGKNNEDGNP
jgi:hypothetical protein